MDIVEMKAFLRKNQITYNTLSEKSGVPIGTVKSIFSGRTKYPRLDTMQAFERALNPSTMWTPNDWANGVIETKKISITADEEEILDIFREIGKKLGTSGQRTFKRIGLTLIE